MQFEASPVLQIKHRISNHDSLVAQLTAQELIDQDGRERVVLFDLPTTVWGDPMTLLEKG